MRGSSTLSTLFFLSLFLTLAPVLLLQPNRYFVPVVRRVEDSLYFRATSLVSSSVWNQQYYEDMRKYDNGPRERKKKVVGRVPKTNAIVLLCFALLCYALFI